MQIENMAPPEECTNRMFLDFGHREVSHLTNVLQQTLQQPRAKFAILIRQKVLQNMIKNGR